MRTIEVRVEGNDCLEDEAFEELENELSDTISRVVGELCEVTRQGYDPVTLTVFVDGVEVYGETIVPREEW